MSLKEIELEVSDEKKPLTSEDKFEDTKKSKKNM